MNPNKNHEMKEISIGSIIHNEKQNPFCISFGFDLSSMIHSMNEVGIINPLIVTESQEVGRYWVVCGYKRLLAAKELGWHRIKCRIYSSLSILDGLWLNIYDNLATRELNPVEKAWVLSRLERYLTWEEIRDKLMPLLGIPAHRPTFELYIEIWRRFDQDLKDMIAKGHLTLPNCKRVLELSDSDIKVISRLLSNIKFNLNQQGQLIDLLADISRSKNMTFSEILEIEGVKKSISNPRITSARRAETLIRELKHIRNPLAETAWNKAKQKVSSLSLPEGVRLNIPPYLEGTKYRLEILFSDGKELEGKLNGLIHNKFLMEFRKPLEEALQNLNFSLTRERR